MPTFTAIALDRLIDPGATTGMSPPSNGTEAADSGTNTTTRLDRRNSTPSRITASADDDDNNSFHGPPLRGPRRMPPPPRSRLAAAKQEQPPIPSVNKNKEKQPLPPQWPQISPALYATPETTPSSLPDYSPTSPSPYVINHKRRGPPRVQQLLQKSSSDASPLTKNLLLLDENCGNNGGAAAEADERKANSVTSGGENSGGGLETELKSNGFHKEIDDHVAAAAAAAINVNGNGHVADGEENKMVSPRRLLLVDRDRQSEEVDDGDFFFDPNDSMSVGSCTDGDGRMTSSMGEFYDACEELSSDSGYQTQPSSRYNLDTELRETRLSLLTEVEKRKQAEDALNTMQNQWHILRQKLREMGLVLPKLPSSSERDGETSSDAANVAVADLITEICQQVYVARIVSESIGKGVGRAECEEELERELEGKQFEIARLCDRLHYYEMMNKEMTQRNQEAIEMARQDRQRRKKIQKYIWGSVAVSITIGTAALAWSCIPSSKGSSSSNSESGSQSK